MTCSDKNLGEFNRCEIKFIINRKPLNNTGNENRQEKSLVPKRHMLGAIKNCLKSISNIFLMQLCELFTLKYEDIAQSSKFLKLSRKQL